MADLAMRPLSVGEVLDRSFALLRRRFAPMFVAGLVCFVVPLAMFVGSIGDLASLALAAPAARGSAAQMGVLWQVMGHFFLIGCIAAVCFVVARGAWIHVAGEAVQGRDAGTAEALRRGLSLALPMAGLTLLEGVIFFGVYFVLAIPAAIVIPLLARSGGSMIGILFAVVAVCGGVALLAWIYAGLYVTAPVLVLETPPNVFRSLERSWNLSRDRRGAVLGIILLLGVLGFVIQMAVTFGVGVFGGMKGEGPGMVGPILVLTYGLMLLVQVVLGLLGYVIQTVMYYDMRVRKEGFDLEVLAQSLEGK
jgi:hypothetical protein